MTPDPIEAHLRHLEECDRRDEAPMPEDAEMSAAKLLDAEERAIAEQVERERVGKNTFVSPERVRLERQVARMRAGLAGCVRTEVATDTDVEDARRTMR